MCIEISVVCVVVFDHHLDGTAVGNLLSFGATEGIADEVYEKASDGDEDGSAVGNLLSFGATEAIAEEVYGMVSWYVAFSHH